MVYDQHAHQEGDEAIALGSASWKPKVEQVQIREEAQVSQIGVCRVQERRRRRKS